MAENISKIIFEAVDHVSATVKNIQKNVTSSLTQISRNIPSVTDAVSNLNSAFNNVARSLTGLTLVAAGVGASVIGITKTYGDMAEATLLAAERTGLTAESFQELSYAAKLSEVDVGELTQSLSFLTRSIQTAVLDSTSEQAKAFRGAGLSAEFLAANANNTLAVFNALSDSFAKSNNVGAKNLSMMTLMGRSSQKLTGLLNQGSAALRETSDEAQRFGLVVSEEALKTGEEFGDTLTKLTLITQSYRNLIAQSLLPILQPLINRLLDWHAANRELIRSNITEFVRSAWKEISNLWDAMRNIFRATWAVLQPLGGLRTVFYAIIGLKLGELAVNVIKLSKAFVTLGAAILLNPWTYVVLGIVAVGYALYKLITNFDAVKEAWNDLWPDMVAILENALNIITGGLYNWVKSIYQNWDEIKAGFAATWEYVKAGFIVLWENISEIGENALRTAFPGLMAVVDKVKEHWETLKTFFAELFDWIKGAFDSFLNHITGGLTGIVNDAFALMDRLRGKPTKREPVQSATRALGAPVATNIADAFKVATQAPALRGGGNLGADITARTFRKHVKGSFSGILPEIINDVQKFGSAATNAINRAAQPGGLFERKISELTGGLKSITGALVPSGANRPAMETKPKFTPWEGIYSPGIVPAPTATQGTTPEAPLVPGTPTFNQAQQQNVRLFVSMKIDSEGRPKDITSQSDVPLEFDANTGIVY